MSTPKRSTTDTWHRLARTIRLVAILVVVAVVGMVVYQVYDFYGNKMGMAPERAIERYLTALGNGDYDEVYRLTAPSSLVDLDGRPVSPSQYTAHLQKLTSGVRQSFTIERATRLTEQSGSRYYEVILLGSGGGRGRMIIEVRRESSGWVVANPFVIVR